jgi:hypothetical protein
VIKAKFVLKIKFVIGFSGVSKCKEKPSTFLFIANHHQNTPYEFPFSSKTATCAVHHFLFDMINRKKFGEEYTT